MAVVSFPSKSGASAVSLDKLLAGAHKSGFRLVRKKRNKGGRLASVRELAKIAFEPWKRDEHLEKLLHPKRFEEIGVWARAAYAMLLMSREELINAHENQQAHVMDEAFTGLSETAALLKSFAHMIETANNRQLAAMCAFSQRLHYDRKARAS